MVPLLGGLRPRDSNETSYESSQRILKDSSDSSDSWESESSYGFFLEEDGACDCEMVDQGTFKGIDPIIIPNLSQKLQKKIFC